MSTVYLWVRASGRPKAVDASEPFTRLGCVVGVRGARSSDEARAVLDAAASMGLRGPEDLAADSSLTEAAREDLARAWTRAAMARARLFACHGALDDALALYRARKE